MSELLKRSVDVDDYPIKTVDGVPVRLVPLAVRGPQRRAKVEALSDGPVTVTLTGTYSKGAVSLDPPERGDTIPLFRGEKAVLAVAVGSVARVERRGGMERRKA